MSDDHCFLSSMGGYSPQFMINEMCERIAKGEISWEEQKEIEAEHDHPILHPPAKKKRGGIKKDSDESALIPVDDE